MCNTRPLLGQLQVSPLRRGILGRLRDLHMASKKKCESEYVYFHSAARTGANEKKHICQKILDMSLSAPPSLHYGFVAADGCRPCRTHVLIRKKRRAVMPRIAWGPQASATLCKKRRALPHPIPWGVTGKCGALGMHFYTVFTCFSCCTHVLTRKKRRAVMPRIAWGPPACTFTHF